MAYRECDTQQQRPTSLVSLLQCINLPSGESGFNNLISFYVGGVVTETRRYLVLPTPFGNLIETTGHGAWEPTGRNTFEAFFRFLLQNDDDGAAIGTDNLPWASGGGWWRIPPAHPTSG
jgi:hypothetical protein